MKIANQQIFLYLGEHFSKRIHKCFKKKSSSHGYVNPILIWFHSSFRDAIFEFFSQAWKLSKDRGSLAVSLHDQTFLNLIDFLICFDNWGSFQKQGEPGLLGSPSSYGLHLRICATMGHKLQWIFQLRHPKVKSTVRWRECLTNSLSSNTTANLTNS